MSSLGLASISTLAETADVILDGCPEDETIRHIANALYVSLERFESELKTSDALTRSQVYGLAFDSFHFASALRRLLTTEENSNESLELLMHELKRIALVHEPEFVGVSA